MGLRVSSNFQKLEGELHAVLQFATRLNLHWTGRTLAFGSPVVSGHEVEGWIGLQGAYAAHQVRWQSNPVPSRLVPLKLAWLKMLNKSMLNFNATRSLMYQLLANWSRTL